MSLVKVLLPLLAGIASIHAAKAPVVQSVQYIANFSDPRLDRDSCTSSKLGDREFWTCRDTNNYPGQDGFFYTSTASWSDFFSNGIPKFSGPVLPGYGDNNGPYFPAVQHDGCDSNGFCNDGTRWVGWPDTRPLPMQYFGGAWFAYSWILNIHLDGLTSLNGPPYTCGLYRTYFNNQDTNDLPPVTLINPSFWNGICYGNYGWAVSPDNSTAYLYGTAKNGIALAKVPLYSVENKTAYTYYQPSTKTWVKTPPSYTDSSIVIPNAGNTFQGTFYYSSYFGQYVWIGASYGVGSEFQIATAPAAEGPWSKPTTFLTAPSGNAGLRAYSQQAHPGLSQFAGQGRDIYLTYTRLDGPDDNNFNYSTPLIHVVWQ